MNKDRLQKIESAGFVLKPDSPEIKPIFQEIRKLFEERGIRVALAERSAAMIGERGTPFEKMCEESDFLVSLGGDGTLLSLVRRSYPWHKPVVGINAGNLGFLADVTIEEVPIFLDQLFDGRYRIDCRLMIAGHIEKASGAKVEFFALNDVVVSSPIPSKMVIVNASIEEERFNTYRGDGLIISTPTGSTAYNLAAGGPVVYPLTRAFILTPVLAHSLTNQRPLVVPADFAIELDTEKYEAIATIDGQERYEIEEGDRVFISVAKEDARLLHRQERNYFSVLRDKLHWGDRNW
ncbi:NAD(+)/NADH kinase [Nitratifractor salsuginis]|uniref:NAD kinase n=1 Tax=Nitratifractor salsuginis (strain DSM 16511 / JCM 12458 / E9I37-1) TaxID=749222 RepID=E6WY17_NITSE|nr:NAD(+)/NADH kinase [Nitratifractor salsuginis]ADV46391.1 ATP-NAD/AcoX kinase [Nitratifractor salsuginis DSM 16511]